MEKKNVIEVVKVVGGCVAAWGTTLIVEAAVDSLKSEENSTTKNVLMGFAGLAIAGMFAGKVFTHVYDGFGKVLDTKEEQEAKPLEVVK